MTPDQIPRVTMWSFMGSFLALSAFVMLSLLNEAFQDAAPPLVMVIPLAGVMLFGPLTAIVLSIAAMVNIAKLTGEKKGWTPAVVGLFFGITCLHLTLAFFTFKGFD